ncbi:MAG: succinate dehydrogenase iron-sulfur subunit [Deltaproteobacteria bacterium]|nr:MAG: succinate dehydrogenase iron-sulfur subunit [Deltaproteobacteria bacterium]
MTVLEIQRYLPESDQAPRWQRYEVEGEPAWSLIDALGYIKDHVDPTLAWRASCRMGMCGSCGVLVDGVPRLGCEVFLRDLPDRPARIAPLAHLPVERDLMVDTEGYLRRLRAVEPWLQPSDADPVGPVGERLQTPAQQAKYLETAQCIGCMLCYAACPQVAVNEPFLGPAALAAAHRYLSDSRDHGHARRGSVQGLQGVWGCTLVGTCSEACPKGVDPAAAIQREKVRGALSFVPSLFVRGEDD